jgi:hypothetical protein
MVARPENAHHSPANRERLLDHDPIIAAVRNWVETLVVGLNLMADGIRQESAKPACSSTPTCYRIFSTTTIF